MSAPSRSPHEDRRNRGATAGQTRLPVPRVAIDAATPATGRYARELERALADAGVALDPESPVCRVIVFAERTLEVLARIREWSTADTRVVAVHVGAPLGGAECLALLDAGASDAVEWSVALEIAGQLRARLERWATIDAHVNSASVASRLVGSSPRWRAVVRDLVEVACFSSSSILITGESGTGKELAARLVHELDPRRDKRELVLVDCTTIVPSLSGSEFFGHERGAFTGAVSPRDGAFALAHQGTLFLDEVGELPLGLQPELLRVVQEGAYKRVGSNAWHRTMFRLVCATNRDLFHEVEEGRFRHDLYHRIAAWRCALPSLRDRREDIPLLAKHFLGDESPTELQLSPAVIDYLWQREYPGNVRELRHVVARLRHRHVGPGPITLADLPENERALAVATSGSGREEDAPEGLRDLAGDLRRAVRAQLEAGRSMREIVSAARETALEEALNAELGNVTRAATRLGITRRAVQLRRAHADPQVAADE